MMMLRSKASKFLAVCCCIFLALRVEAINREKDCEQQKDRYDATLIIPSNYEQASYEDAEGNGNIHTQSLSPWTWKSSTLKGRIPATIWEAECSTTTCSYASISLGYASYNSAPIVQKVLVLQPTGNNNSYSTSYLSVSVGCTCVLAQTN
ncbi:interleukin 17a/f2 [Osmerus eperlanus]|uniref:interleukin 17a/f2 n=1 Tax=Osmerus eperlanus TaxID=29151 RepID=UPI002E161F64